MSVHRQIHGSESLNSRNPMKALFLLPLLWCWSLWGTVIMGPIYNPANGHSYSLLAATSWSASQTEAVSLSGNLATINDAAENDWVFDTFSGGGQKNLWIGFNDTNMDNVFSWVDGSPTTYVNWDAGQPNLGSERWVFMVRGNLGSGQVARKWHDVIDNATEVYGVVELLTAPYCSPHRAAATASVVNGFVVGATMTDYGCGYTNPPVVLIQGGGGSNAGAVAVVSNGVVNSIQITNAGCCYTSTPQIVIGSPPFVPTVGIRFSKVKVTQNVVLGRNYVLESSTNMIDWTATGPPYTATNETITAEFDLDLTGRFFRVRQVP